jgi:hypothetical protein
METHAIDWESATVTLAERDFELGVALDGEPSPAWSALFQEAVEQEALKLQGRGWGVVRMAGGSLSLQLRPEARDQARRFLEDLVSGTNAALAAQVEEEERERLRAEQERAEQERTAEELTRWFRSAAPPADAQAPGSPAARDPEPADSGRVDLRDRLLHAFGAGAGD